MLPEQVEERRRPHRLEESRRRDAVLAPEEEDEHRLRRDAVRGVFSGCDHCCTMRGVGMAVVFARWMSVLTR